MVQVWVVVLLFVVGLCLPTSSIAAPDYTAIVVDSDSGTVLEAIEPHQRWYPASLTKLMTLYVAFAEIDAGRLSLAESLVVSGNAAAQPATRLALHERDTITVEQAVLAVILQSANDAAVVLAERIAGTESAFATLMTNTGKRLGMTRTIFRNASGLPNPEQVTTARDMAVLARALLRDFPQYYHYFAERDFTYHGRKFSTINGILARYPGADGLKTGFTCSSGYNLVASAVRDGRRLIGVVLGSASRADRVEEMVTLLDTGFQMASVLGKPHSEFTTLWVPPETDGLTLPVPQQLPSRDCKTGPTLAIAAGSHPNVRLAGWGVILGAYFSRSDANLAISQARRQLRELASAGQATLIPRRWQNVESFAALLVGLKQDEAGKVCKQLRGKGLYCQSLSPQALSNPNAMWR
jgi:D-alanyl-D-alanine carboxypeptidase